ncbi:hypothetical protein GFS60_07165 (plasmid) [Rhodococcus sp. WAY2]|nr:hypothetical protein GFS60_07165 [Rhodococcus sp. WAY2]
MRGAGARRPRAHRNPRLRTDHRIISPTLRAALLGLRNL